MHALENQNTAGTSLEPPWNIAGTLLVNWNIAGAWLEHCWHSAGTCWKVAEILLEPCWNLTGTLEPCCWNLWLEHFAGGQCGCRFRFSFYIVSCFAYCAGLWYWKSGLNFAGTGLQPCWNLYIIWGQLLDFLFLFGQAIKDDDPLLKLCWNPCLNLWRNLCWNPGMNLALQGSKVARPRGKFQACNAYRYKFFKVPWFQDLMTHEAALHIKQRKM